MATQDPFHATKMNQEGKVLLIIQSKVIFALGRAVEGLESQQLFLSHVYN